MDSLVLGAATPVVVNCPTDNLLNVLNAAQPGSSIEVHGTCTGHFTINVNDLLVAGAGLGRSGVLDGGGSGTVLTVKAGVSATLNYINIQYGSTSTGTSGAGIANHGTLTLYVGRVTNNTSGGGGGGIYNEGTFYLRRSGVANNTANGGGGGIWNKGAANVLNSAVSGNQANNGANDGGIRNDDTLTLSGSGVNANMANGGGGGGTASSNVIKWNNGATTTLGPTTAVPVTHNACPNGESELSLSAPIAASTTPSITTGMTSHADVCIGTSGFTLAPKRDLRIH